MTGRGTDAAGPRSARARRRAPTVRFLLALAGLSLGVLAAAVIAGLAVWEAMDTAVREAALQAVRERAGVLVLLALLTIAGIAAVLTVPFRRHVIPALRLEEEGRLMLEVHTRHRIEPAGADELRRIAVLLNDYADRHAALRDDVEQHVADAAAALATQRDRLSALVSQLPQALLVCNGGGRIVLYNDRAHALGEDAQRFVGLDRPVYDLIDRVTLDAALEQVARARRAGEHAPAATFVSALSDAQRVRVHVGALDAAADDARGGFVLLLEPVAEHEDTPPVPLLERRLDRYDFGLLRAVAAPSEWDDTPLSQLTCTVFDTETTGLWPGQGDEIISIGAVRVVAGRVLAEERFAQLVDPQRPVPQESVRIHGITRAMLEGQPVLADVVPAFARFCADTVLVGHTVAFDLRFLEVAEPRTGVRLAQPVLDTLLLSAVVHPHQPIHTLDAVAARLGVDVEGRHTAIGDALATAEVLVRLIPLLAARGIVTLGQARAAAVDTPPARITY